MTRFVLPLGSTLNMDGTALYEAAAAIFVAQFVNYPLEAVEYVIICLTVTLASMGVAGIPGAGLVVLVLVFDCIGLPAEHISLIIPLDWFANRFRATYNILGDAFGAAIINHICRKELEEIDEKHADDNVEYDKLSETATDKKPSKSENLDLLEQNLHC